MQIETVTKLEAAERQLTSATKLYFNDSDAIAIHTLVAASYNIIRDISKHRNASPTMIKDFFVDSYSGPKKNKIGSWINSFENFFKHADHDPDGTIELNTEITELLLIDAWAQYEKLLGELPIEGKAFRVWTGTPKPDTASDICTLIKSMKKMDKQKFFSLFLEWYDIYIQETERKPSSA